MTNASASAPRLGRWLWVLLLVNGVAAAAAAQEPNWQQSAPGKLRTWVESVTLTAGYDRVGPELMEVVGQARSLMRPPATATAMDSAIHLLAREATGLSSVVDEERATQLYFLVGKALLYQLDDRAGARAALREALSRLRATGRVPSETYFQTAFGLADAYYWDLDAAPVLAVAREAHAHSIAADVPDWQRAFAKWMGRALELERSYDEATVYYAEAYALAGAKGTTAERYEAALDLGTLYSKRGAPAGGLSYVETALALAPAEGRKQEGYARLWYGRMLSELDRQAEAIRELTRARSSLDAAGDPDERAHVCFELARAYRRSGEPAWAVTLIDTVRGIAGKRPTLFYDLFLHEELAESYDALGRHDSALYHLRRHQAIQLALDSLSRDREVMRLARRYELSRDSSLVQAQAAWLRDRRRYRWALSGLGVACAILGAGWYWALHRRGPVEAR